MSTREPPEISQWFPRWNYKVRRRLGDRYRIKILVRDNGQCRHCKTKKKLTIHHTTPLYEIATSVFDKNLLLNEFVNKVVKAHKLEHCITLCEECHSDLHRLEIK
jgi:5-methylcytosine-specific restriction endonuclease McrA